MMTAAEHAMDATLERAPPPRAYAKWTPERIETLKAMRADGMTMAEMGRTLGCSRSVINWKLSHVEVTRTVWTPEMEEDLEKGWQQRVAMVDIARELGVTPAAAQARLTRLRARKGLPSLYAAPTRKRTYKPWSAKDDETLRHLYLERQVSPVEIAEAMGRTLLAIKNRCFTLRLSRDPNWHAA